MPSAPAASLHDTLEAILGHVRRLFDTSGCAFLIVDWETRHIRPEADWFASPEVRAAMAPLLARPYEPGRPGLTEAAIEAAAPLLLRDLEQWPGAQRLRERIEEQLPPAAAAVAWDWYLSSCFIACPMRTTAGNLLGVLAIAVREDRRVGEEDLHTVDVLASLAALALERAELLDREALRAHEELLLGEAARAMTASLDLAVVYDAIVEAAQTITGATKVLLTRFEPAAQELRPVATIGFSERSLRRPIGAGEGMIGQVARTGSPYLSRPEDAERFLRWMVDEERIESFAHVPVRLGPRLFGVLTIADQAAGAVDADALRRLEAVARLAAGAIANALDFQHERRIAQALARGFVPGTPAALEGLETGVVYEPAEHAGGGGDFFGLWRLPSGATGVLLGDVSGKGLEVSAQSAMARFFVEARTWDCEQPAEVLVQVNRLLCARSFEVGLVPTFLAIVAGDTLRYANAGHLPPLLVSADGRLHELRAGGSPLGIELEASWRESEVRFAPGDLLFAATDGLVEARRDRRQFGEERVRALVAEHAHRLAPQELCELCHRSAVEWAARVQDDIVVMAVRRT